MAGKGKYDPAELIRAIWTVNDDDMSVANRLGVDRQQVFRWRNSKVMWNQWEADRMAIRAGTHPACVWGRAWLDEGMTVKEKGCGLWG